MSSLNMPVTLIVKAPNQQIEDQTIQCELSWTIKRLKGYLSEVYPSKPSTDEQKLIYSGHLLNDSCTLQEVLRTYEEGQDQHTVHLVCARNSMVPPKKTGLFIFMKYVIPWTQAQYAAWMHQAYAQYMAQYMHMMSQGSGNPFQWQVPPNVSVRGPQPNFDQPGAAQGQAGVAERPAGAEEGDEEENAGRDWLDLFYMTSRAAAFFAFVYFYTTPMRFLVVFCLGLLMYLYNIGFFRPLDDFVQVAENNNDPARVDAAAAAINGNNDNNNNHQPADGAGGNEEVPQNNPDGAVPTVPPAAPPVPDRPSLLALTWTFFTSFFASLIPEQPGVI
ncbi:hypothetical protein FOCC_FOCC015361 [Frankliniella occidentalis]|nr:hypothetical protein FOCC_FOCC015361 [Frankliniella occidentalis]